MMQRAPKITVIHDLSRATKALFVDQQLVVQSDPSQDDPLYLIDEAAEQLATIHRVRVRQLIGHQVPPLGGCAPGRSPAFED